MADDTTVYLASEKHVARLFDILKVFGKASGQQINKGKSAIILMGNKKGRRDGKGEETAKGEGIVRLEYGKDEIDASLGRDNNSKRGTGGRTVENSVGESEGGMPRQDDRDKQVNERDGESEPDKNFVCLQTLWHA